MCSPNLCILIKRPTVVNSGDGTHSLNKDQVQAGEAVNKG